ncbi:hypothetical protein FNW02_23745 [Komarekiella sp. 'clone 1']|uniref:Uncharacterized protein n=1 Tax=Komarekiella delphini-convector SJRDD-AB1 TaxID=2593771 RepID=A0AA40T1B8_9NOST|nr:hypothetical protein [Komarekiella delphini-convector]MBD6618757.1 hypothetical protein [Komarekiella delphini-convector SJRDD-AB1]
MKRTSCIIANISATAGAIVFGYFGVQYLGRNTMYGVGGGMIGLGTAAQLVQMKPRSVPQPTVTIYDFADLLAKNEPPKKRR